ncbi:MAG: S-layer homology domain-containing protein [Oscillibacter sp.]|nr:S-layer homology domain-containing protein [Oscillibacter sp.]
MHDTAAHNSISRYSPAKRLVALLVVCALVVTALVCGVLSVTAIAADLVIEAGPDNGTALAAQLRAGGAGYDIEDEYGALWGTDTRVEIFKATYTNGAQEVSVAGRNNEKVIAPGTENTYTFAVKNKLNALMDYKVVVEAYVTGLDGTGKTIPVEARLKGRNWLLGSGEEFRPVEELSGVEESAILMSHGHCIYTLEWRWPFEHDLNGDGNIDDGDALDTWLASQQQDISLTIGITVLSAHHMDVGEPAVTAPIPWMLDDVNHMAYLYGFPDDTIRPEADITRAELASIFYRLLREEIREEYRTEAHPYSDVGATAWYRTEMATMSALGVFIGYPDGTFRGSQPITRGEFAAVLARISEEMISTDGFTAFTDIRGHWAEGEIMTIEDFNWIEGYPDGTFAPDEHITRAETAAMINRMLHRLPERLSDLRSNMLRWPDNQDTSIWYYLAMQEASNSHDYARLLGTREKWTRVTDISYLT